MFLGLKVPRMAREEDIGGEKGYSFVSPDLNKSLRFLFDGNGQLTGGILNGEYRFSLNGLLRLMIVFKEKRYRKLPCCRLIPIEYGNSPTEKSIYAVEGWKNNILYVGNYSPQEFHPDIIYALPMCLGKIKKLKDGDDATYNKICAELKKRYITGRREQLCSKLKTPLFLQAMSRFVSNTISSYDDIEMEMILVTFETIIRGNNPFPLEEYKEA